MQNLMLSKRRSGVKAAVIALLVALANSSCKETARDEFDYHRIVRNYADTMIEFGRDRYGEVNSPLFASALDPESLSLLEGEKLQQVGDIRRATWGIRRGDRTLSGANVMHDQNLYQTLYALSALTGDPRYADEADNALKWFFEHCQSPVTGLMAWGEHMGWDFRTETVMRPINAPEHSVGTGMIHEFFRPWVLWEKSFQLNPEACIRFARGLWDHQIYDHETGNFSRHARWDRHSPGRGFQFPRHAGFYIATWAEAFYHSNDKVFLQAIETLMNLYKRHMDPNTGAIPQEIGSARTPENNLLRPTSTVSLAIDLWDGSFRVPDPLAGRMRDFAAHLDEVFNKMKHRLERDGGGFIVLSNTKTLEPEDIRDGRKPGRPTKRVYSERWASEYGDSHTDASTGMLCYLRYVQSGNEGYKGLVVSAARRYLYSEPSIEFPLHPGTMASVIYLMIGAWELSGDDKFLKRAEHFAKAAISLFLQKNSTLPSASSEHHHYETITGSDSLMMALLKLHVVKNKQRSDTVSLVWNDR